jgi:hypothetical protein
VSNELTQDAVAALETSLFQRVPAIAADLIRGGMEPVAAITQAIADAKAHEDALCLMVLDPMGWQQEQAVAELKQYLCARVYRRLRGQSTPVSVNPRWAACEQALGYTPTNAEFTAWG